MGQAGRWQAPHSFHKAQGAASCKVHKSTKCSQKFNTANTPIGLRCVEATAGRTPCSSCFSHAVGTVYKPRHQ